MKETTQFFIGVDVSKLWFDVCVLPVKNQTKLPKIAERFINDKSGIKQFDKWLKKHQVSFDHHTLLVLENTGIYHRHLWAYCSEKELPIHIGNAAHIKWSFGIARGKNDKIDAVRLSSYAQKCADDLKATPNLNSVFLQLKDWMTARTKLLSQVNSIRTYIKELKTVNDKSIQKLLEAAHKQAIAGLLQSIKNIEAAMKKIIDENEAIKINYLLLKTVPGIGHLTAVYMICCTNNFGGKITGKQLACYAGVVPFESTSGISVKGKNRVHKMANKDLKKMLHLCALSVIRFSGEFKDYYERKKAEGKHSMSVLNAIRNKIVLRAVAVVNNKTAYVDNTLSNAENKMKFVLEVS